MTADDLSAPLGRQPKKRRLSIKIPVPQIIAGALALFLGVFVLWAVVADDPFGGEPMAVVPANLRVTAKPADAAAAPKPLAAAEAVQQHDEPSALAATAPGSAPAAPANTTTVTIIDGKTGAHQDVQVAAPTANAAAAGDTAAPAAVPLDQKFVEITPHGPIPKIAADGTRPADAFARPVQPLPGRPDAPRIALIVGGLGVSGKYHQRRHRQAAGAVTLGFVPYGGDVAALVARARNERPRGAAAGADGAVRLSG